MGQFAEQSQRGRTSSGVLLLCGRVARGRAGAGGNGLLNLYDLGDGLDVWGGSEGVAG